MWVCISSFDADIRLKTGVFGEDGDEFGCLCVCAGVGCNDFSVIYCIIISSWRQLGLSIIALKQSRGHAELCARPFCHHARGQ